MSPRQPSQVLRPDVDVASQNSVLRDERDARAIAVVQRLGPGAEVKSRAQVDSLRRMQQLQGGQLIQVLDQVVEPANGQGAVVRHVLDVAGERCIFEGNGQRERADV